MIYALPMFIACIMAAFFCYLIANSFPTLRNRACRIVCISCPILLASLLFAFSDALLNPLHDFLRSLPRFREDAIVSLAIIVAPFLVFLTLLLANLTAQIRILNRHGSDTK